MHLTITEELTVSCLSFLDCMVRWNHPSVGFSKAHDRSFTILLEMNQLPNAFSLLELDVADDREQTAVAGDGDCGKQNKRAKGKKKDSSGDLTNLKTAQNAFSLLELDVADDREQTTVAGDGDCGKQNKRAKGKKKDDSSRDLTNLKTAQNAFSLLELDVAYDREPTTIAGDGDCGKQNKRAKGKKKDDSSGDLTNLKTAQNAFSLLELGVADDMEQTTVAGDGDCGKQNKRAKGKNKDDSSGDLTNLKSENGVQQNSEVVRGEYKLPLVWIDLEMTGLNVEVDKILEIACIITDGNLTKLIEGPDLVIHQSKEYLDKMGEWCQEHHAASGLTEKVLRTSITEHEAEMQVVEFVKKNIGTYTPLLAGNSVYVDFQFLKKYMPVLASLFSHVLVDVSSVKALCLRWYPRDNKKAPQKENKHRAMDDIKESIAELKYYKESIFKVPKNKK